MFKSYLRDREGLVIVLCLVLVVGVISYMAGNGMGAPELTGGKVYDPPELVKTIKLDSGSKPAWVYNADDKLYVNYFGHDRVDVFNSEGKKIGRFFTSLITGPASPQGMALIGERMLIADFGNKALSVFNPGGKFIEAFSARSDGEGFTPVGAAVYNKVFYVTDLSVNGWMAIGNDGQLINVVPGDDDKTFLKFPYGIVVTRDGRVIVTDPKGGKIKVFSCPGWYAYDFPAKEIGMVSPQGIAIDGYDRVHVVDNAKDSIFVYDNKGYFLFSYGKGLQGPSTITVDKERKTIYIANTERAEISVWSY